MFTAINLTNIKDHKENEFTIQKDNTIQDIMKTISKDHKCLPADIVLTCGSYKFYHNQKYRNYDYYKLFSDPWAYIIKHRLVLQNISGFKTPVVDMRRNLKKTTLRKIFNVDEKRYDIYHNDVKLEFDKEYNFTKFPYNDVLITKYNDNFVKVNIFSEDSHNFCLDCTINFNIYTPSSHIDIYVNDNKIDFDGNKTWKENGITNNDKVKVKKKDLSENQIYLYIDTKEFDESEIVNCTNFNKYGLFFPNTNTKVNKRNMCEIRKSDQHLHVTEYSKNYLKSFKHLTNSRNRGVAGVSGGALVGACAYAEAEPESSSEEDDDDGFDLFGDCTTPSRPIQKSQSTPNSTEEKFKASFIDVSNKNLRKTNQWSNTAPPWRVVSKGLCLEGKCTNYNCEAYDKTIISKFGLGTFDFSYEEDVNQVKCPMCRRNVKPIICGLNNCQWKYIGKKPDSDEILSGEWEELGDEYTRFEEITKTKTVDGVKKKIKEGIVNWERLMIITMRTMDFNCKKYELSHDNNACSICIDDIDEKNGSMLKCNHLFHEECIDDWHKSEMDTTGHRTCPLCRTEVE